MAFAKLLLNSCRYGAKLAKLLTVITNATIVHDASLLMYIFERKVRFYEKRHQRQANRMLVISPMIDARAQPVAQQLGIEVYTGSVVEVKSLLGIDWLSEGSLRSRR